MQLLPTFGAASGKAGGIVASHGTAGAQLFARRQHTQPRSTSQQNHRATFGTLASAWKGLTASQKAGWTVLASQTEAKDRLGQVHTPSGYTLFIRCNQNLASIGLPIQPNAAASVPSLPKLTSFTATATYDSDIPPSMLTGFQLSYAPAVPSPWTALVRASASHSATRGNIRPGELRTVAILPYTSTLPAQIMTSWQAIFGCYPPYGTITFELGLTDPTSGFTTPRLRAAAAFGVTGSTPASTQTIAIYVGPDLTANAALQDVYVGPDVVAVPK